MVDPVSNMDGDDPLPDVDHEPEGVQSHEAQFVPPIRINLMKIWYMTINIASNFKCFIANITFYFLANFLKTTQGSKHEAVLYIPVTNVSIKQSLSHILRHTNYILHFPAVSRVLIPARWSHLDQLNAATLLTPSCLFFLWALRLHLPVKCLLHCLQEYELWCFFNLKIFYCIIIQFPLNDAFVLILLMLLNMMDHTGKYLTL